MADLQSEFYDAFAMREEGNELPMLFSIRDEAYHTQVRKPISKDYSMSAITQYEHQVDTMISDFISCLVTKFDRNNDGELFCEMDDWVQFFSFDVISQITFGQAFGFLKSGSDLFGFMKLIEDRMDGQAPNAALPRFARLKHRLSLAIRQRDEFEAPFAKFVLSHIRDREQRNMEGKPPTNSNNVNGDGHKDGSDFLDRFLEAKARAPETMDFSWLWCYSITNVVAGSDTVAIPLRTIIYHVLSNPGIHQKLLSELRGANLKVPVSWDRARQLPYLDAVINEALRIHPPVGLGLERVVPETGLRLPNQEPIEAGVLVSINPWVMNRRFDVFGDDSDVFRPERWLKSQTESGGEYQSRLTLMRRASFVFGYGPRTCIGKHISLFEIYKCVPSLFLSLDMEIKDAEWWTWNNWFVRQKGLNVYLRSLDLGN
ncbi:hypothetical protein TWF718_003756 [Orbilia javanica]|uniref:Cytochrome P450 n=1 Tax=Orbilia javanica TaxID=47235 RepID=A0AAN8N4N1_9PEZI